MLGVDAVSIKRFHFLRQNDFSSWQKIFTEKEWNYCFSQGKTAERLASIFAAKESVMKALGGKYVGRFDWLEIKHNRAGKPSVSINQQKKFKKKMELSVAHDGDIVIAVALVGR